MIEKDLNKVAKIEKAIKEKYGQEAIDHPKKNWNPIKEKKYLNDLKKITKSKHKKKVTKEEGFTLKQSKTKHSINRDCKTCGKYSFAQSDDLYMLKFDCCFDCYIKYVEGREERWNSGWRPNS